MALSFDAKFNKTLENEQQLAHEQYLAKANVWSLRQKEADEQQKEADEKKRRDDFEQEKIDRGYDLDVPKDLEAKKVEVPFTTEVLALEFVILFLVNNKQALQCASTIAFNDLFEPFFWKYINAKRNFQRYLQGTDLTKAGVKRWCKDYYATRARQGRRDAFREQCWRFLTYVNATTCLRAITKARGGFYAWVGTSADGALQWHLKPEELDAYTMPSFVYYGYFRDQEERTKVESDSDRDN